ncbi:MAG: monovalent cation/H+ antiporter subunit D family protein [Rhodospirillaceae bacterium]|nr:monovalent cation/H+ antiporter subunit D family protein [Rhodospirillaceae bacterium]MBT6137529.1 monovalent cation/H+ antiporter subunit D family protein [Rhodospirillaceae bacterium]
MIAALEPHLAILQVVVPLISAPLCSMLRRGDLAWMMAMVVSWLAFAMSIALLAQVMATGDISYHVGNWAPPWGIEYRIDAVNAFVLLIVSGIGAVVLPYAKKSVEREIKPSRRAHFYTAYLLCLAGLLGVTATGDAFNVFVFLEISSLSTYTLVALGADADRRALPAAYNYLVMGTVGATFFVIGLGLMYMVTGTLNMADLAARLPELGANRTVDAAFAFIVVGLGLKLAMFPMHVWLPNAYTYAPSVVTAFLAATATKVAVYVLLRFVFTVFGTGFEFAALTLTWVLIPLALAAMFVATIAAIYQVNVKRLLAFSSVAQLGYMVLGIGMLSTTGLTATILHLFNHALMKGALFLAIGAVAYRVGSTNIEAMRGLGKRMPWTMAAFSAGGLSLIGVPTTVGFISKWYLVMAAIENGWWPIAVLIVASSLLAIFYVWKVIEAAYFREADDETAIQEAPMSMLVPLWLLVLANFYFGIDAELTTSVATTAAKAFLGGGG